MTDVASKRSETLETRVEIVGPPASVANVLAEFTRRLVRDREWAERQIEHAAQTDREARDQFARAHRGIEEITAFVQNMGGSIEIKKVPAASE